MHIMKKLLSLTLSALLILSLLPAGVMAEETTGWTVTASVNSDAVGYMTDGNTTVDGSSRWTSNGGIGTGQSYESVSITIAFDTPTNVQSVKLCSGTDYAVAYTAYVSSTGEDNDWTTVSSSTEGTATDDYQTISINSTSVSYIKIECTQTVNGYSWWSIYELTIVEDNGWKAEATATGDGDSVDYMFDNDTTTRWSSGGGIGDEQSYSSVTVTVNFGEATAVSSVSLLSSSDYAVAYMVSMSTDGSSWTEVASSTEGTVNDDGYQIISFTETTGSYLKIECTQVHDSWRYWSIYELAINVDTTSSGDDEEMTTWQITASTGYTPEIMIDGDYTIGDDYRWTTYSDIGYENSELESAYVTLDLGSAENVSSIRLLSCNDYALEYTLEYSTDGTNWTEIISSYEVSNDYQIITFSTVYARYLKITCTKSCEGNYWSIYEIDINVTDDESDTVLPSLYGWALTLDGRIGVTYYFDMTDVDDADSYVLNVTIGDRSETIYHGDSKTDGTEDNTTEYYRYTVYVGVAEINSTITATITNGTNSSAVTDYSVATYCSTAIESNLAESSLCTALLTYGNYARVVNGDSAELDSSYKLEDDYSVSISDDYGEETTSTSGYLKTLALGDVIYIRVYMATSQTVKVDGVEYEPVTNSDYEGYTCYIEFPVSAKNMDEIYTVCSTDDTELTSYSVYYYIKNQLANDDADDNLKNLCKAIYNYSQAAEDYSGWH
ncbi:MAG: discoidin domain-containing protein [Ruminococcus sp.]|nr:discoidin domain-containing protein [Ruminococcus sp.]